MKRIKAKLLSRGGESLLIALVFMLFCCFVGGAVLAASTQQLSYIKRMSQTEQQYLTQRSAITLISDSLKPGLSDTIRLTVADQYKTTRDVTISDGGVETLISTGEPARELAFVVSGADETSIIQRFLLETAILRYLEENNISDDVPITVSGFGDLYTAPAGVDTYDARTDFIAQSAGTDSRTRIEVTDPTDPGTAITAYLTAGEGDHRYNFIISFGEDASQVVMTMYSHLTERARQVSAPEYRSTGSSHYDKITVESSVFIIDWDAPVLEKGGLEE